MGHIVTHADPAGQVQGSGAAGPAAQEALYPKEAVLPFGPQEAAVAARLYRAVRRPRGRELDLAIAACAIARDADL